MHVPHDYMIVQTSATVTVTGQRFCPKKQCLLRALRVANTAYDP
jgi:hypothetical protein